MATLPNLRLDRRLAFQVGDVVRFDRVAYAHLTRGLGALVEMEARRLPPILGQVTQIEGSIVQVIWEDGRMVFYSDQGRIPWYTTTEVLILE